MKDLVETYAQVIHNQALACLQVKFKGFIPYDNFVKILQHEYAMIRYYKLKKCIIDLREMGIYAPGVSELVKNEWFGQVLKDGLQHVAFVVPESIFGQQSMNKAHQTLKEKNPLTITYFKDLPTAQQWIERTT
ncbi:hypothetical protein Q0590_34970 [Rhodocytophaga aerolata]|uniref:STAS/SEC14 domain-containing protein n=1 Tax=Rhodocytophaga aerolata TaxID=455078 RepID=A0ABT8RJS2_9BACT|nr:hypothetical protein [Rhodocytophaga aerolata]MDO1451528.1 hypothetical protein [Rhodocytophaga aerolata]